MKKALLAFAAGIFALFSTFAADKSELPSFPNAKNAVVVGTDKLQMWKFNDFTRRYIDVANKTTETGIPVKIYTMKNFGDKWQELGSMELGVPCSNTEFDSTKFGSEYRKYKYFALVPQNGKKYKVVASDDYLDYAVFSKAWLVLNVMPENPDEDMSYKENAVIIRRSDFDPKYNFEDNIKVVNKTGDRNFSISIYAFNENGFNEQKLDSAKKYKERFTGSSSPNPSVESQKIVIYGYNVKTEAWNSLCAATFTNNSEADANYHPNYSKWKWWGGAVLYENFAIVSSNGKKYKVKPRVERSNLTIELLPE